MKLQDFAVQSRSTREVVDGVRFRSVMAHYPTGVCAVTSIAEDGDPLCMIVGSFTSVSLTPPLVGFFPAHGSETWPRIAEAGSFCVNVLAGDQRDLCRHLAMKGADRFAGLSWDAAGSGSPILDGVVAWIDCDIETVTRAGDHDFVLGRVRDLRVTADKPPLLFHRGDYGCIA